MMKENMQQMMTNIERCVVVGSRLWPGCPFCNFIFLVCWWHKLNARRGVPLLFSPFFPFNLVVDWGIRVLAWCISYRRMLSNKLGKKWTTLVPLARSETSILAFRDKWMWMWEKLKSGWGGAVGRIGIGGRTREKQPSVNGATASHTFFIVNRMASIWK